LATILLIEPIPHTNYLESKKETKNTARASECMSRDRLSERVIDIENVEIKRI